MKWVSAITEQEFRRLCDDLYAGREDVYPLSPSMSKREALLWMLYGSLVSLLDVPADYQPPLTPETSADPYFYAICDLLPRHMEPPFDAGAILAEFLEKLEDELQVYNTH